MAVNFLLEYQLSRYTDLVPKRTSAYMFAYIYVLGMGEWRGGGGGMAGRWRGNGGAVAKEIRTRASAEIKLQKKCTM